MLYIYHLGLVPIISNTLVAIRRCRLDFSTAIATNIPPNSMKLIDWKRRAKLITKKTKHSIGWSNRYHKIWLVLWITILYGQYRYGIWQAALQLCHMDTSPPDSWSWWAGRQKCIIPWWRHQMETFSAILALCEGNPLVIGGFPSQKTTTRRFDVSAVCAWTYSSLNNRNAGDLRRHRARYDVFVMHWNIWYRKTPQAIEITPLHDKISILFFNLMISYSARLRRDQSSCLAIKNI